MAALRLTVPLCSHIMYRQRTKHPKQMILVKHVAKRLVDGPERLERAHHGRGVLVKAGRNLEVLEQLARHIAAHLLGHRSRTHVLVKLQLHVQNCQPQLHRMLLASDWYTSTKLCVCMAEQQASLHGSTRGD